MKTEQDKRMTGTNEIQKESKIHLDGLLNKNMLKECNQHIPQFVTNHEPDEFRNQR